MIVFTHGSAVTADSGGDEELRTLVDDVRSGQTAALDHLIRRVRDRVRRWAHALTRDADTADDVTQDVLIHLEQRVQRYRGDSRFSTWLYTVTRHVALSRATRDQRRAALMERRRALSVPESPVATRDLDALTLGALVLRYLDTLPRRQRLIFELADLRGWTPAEIAEELGVEQTTVRVHLFKARQRIRAQLLEHHRRMVEEYRS